MFDKFLCRRIHKKEIRIKDILENIIETIYNIVEEYFDVFMVCTGFGVITSSCLYVILNLNDSLSTKLILIVLSPVIGFVEIIVIMETTERLGKIIKRLGNVKVAECPLNKEEKESKQY